MILARQSPSTGPTSPDIWGLHEEDTGAIQHPAACPRTRKAAPIDVVPDFDPLTARTSCLTRCGTAKPEFIKTRDDRAATPALPDRMPHAAQVNLRGGRLHPAEAYGHSNFKTTANKF